MSGLLGGTETADFLQLPGYGVVGQERAARPWQQDSAGPKLQEAGKIC